MESTEQIKARLENIRGLEPIFVALRTIALSSQRAASRRLETSDLYYSRLVRVHSLVAQHVRSDAPRRPEACRRSVLLIVGNQRGLCGPFASAVVSAAEEALEELRTSQDSGQVDIMVLGARARREAQQRGLEVVWEGVLPFTSVPPLALANQLAATGMQRYEAGEIGSFRAVYNHYLGGGTYSPRAVTLIPVPVSSQSDEAFPWPLPILETDVSSLHRRVIRQLTELAFYRVLLQSAISEQSARFQLMEGASDNSRELIEELAIAYQTARQDDVTQEMLELAVSAGLIGYDQAR